MAIEINNLTKFKIDRKSFAQVAKKVFSGENKGTETLSLAFVNKQEMRGLNKKYRGKDEPTDVLSFDLSPKIKNQKSKIQFKNQSFLGEIVICPNVALENSRKHKTAFEQEIMKVFIHGILHLLGYEHEKSEKEREKMKERENYYLKNYSNCSNYSNYSNQISISNF